ncbi:MAG: KOW motif-containing protein [Sphaerochaetaceae bacterium]|nr:KOW motif-containing protein [Sphaerochaetaceae bacterium]
MRSYCIYCKTGSEHRLVEHLSKMLKELYESEPKLLFPVRLVHEKHRGRWSTVEQPLLPGYLFLYVDDTEVLAPYIIKQERDVYKILRYTDGTMQLRDGDEAYAMWVLRYKGRLAPSKAICEAGRLVKILEGPLIDMEGKIVKVDRHKKRVVVAFDFAGMERLVNLSVDLLTSAEAAR